MKINTSKAISLFHPKPSYQQIYFEAVANALDANADQISIKIEMESYEEVASLRVTIEDNGVGFTDRNFEKFSKLLEVESPDHKRTFEKVSRS